MSRLVLAIALLAASTSDARALLCTPILGCTCNVVASDIDFEAISPLAGAQNGEGEISVDCTGVIDVAPSIQTRINRGTWGTFAVRKMRNGSGELLDYNIYTTSQHSAIWGDGTGGTQTMNISGGLLSVGHWSASRTMFGVVTPTITTKPGTYTDSVVVRIIW